MALAKNGAEGGFGITPALVDDNEAKAAQRAAGEQEYALRLPSGKEVDISDAPVLGPLAQAAGTAYNVLENNKDLGTLEAWRKAMASGTGKALETAALQGINRLAGSNYYGSEGDLGERFAQTIGSAAGQLVPSLLRQTAQTVDPYQRDLGEYGTSQYYLNSVLNAIPGLREKFLNPKIDNEGNPILQNQGRSLGKRAFENYILPYKVTEPEYTPLGATAANIFNETGGSNANGFPKSVTRNAMRDWLGDDYSEQNYYDVNNAIKSFNGEIGNKLIEQDWFNNLSADDQGKALNDAYTAIQRAAREDVDETFDGNNKLAKAFRDGGVDGMIDALKKQMIFSSNDVNTTNNHLNAAYEAGGEEGLQQALTVDDAIRAHGYDVNSTQEFANSLPSLDDFEEYANFIDKTKGMKNTPESRAWYSKYGLEGLKTIDGADTNNNGALTKDELITYYQNLGYTPEQVNEIFKAIYPHKWNLLDSNWKAISGSKNSY